ncbi:TetR/AcrR family transcriptional regulator [Tsukamurella soli]|uniref:TetR/AcrR family transcriptional regulator n=1 Tax=Tsukamurella soli TaxID=644556 RepID=A0ABP8JL04_9ACTN
MDNGSPKTQEARSGDEAADSRRGPQERTRRAVMDAARELLRSAGFADLTVDGIAARSGVGKATIYRWWSNRADVAMDALLEERGPVGWFVEDRPAIENLRAQLLVATEFLGGPNGTVVAGLLGDVQHDPQIARAFRERFLSPLVDLTRTLLAMAVDEGDVRPDLDHDLLIDLLTGPIYFRLLVTGEPLTASATHSLVDAVLRGARPA